MAIILIEHSESEDLNALEESLITHNTADLAARLDKHRPLSLSAVHRDF